MKLRDVIKVSLPEFGDYVGVLDEVSCEALFTEEINIPETEEYYGYEGTGVITLTFTASGFSGSETGTLDMTESGVAVDSCSLNVLMTGTKM